MTEEKIYKILKDLDFIKSTKTITLKELLKIYTKTGVDFLLIGGYIEEIAEKVLPKTWGELEKISGWYVAGDSSIQLIENTDTEPLKRNKNVFFSHEEADAAVALAQLSQLRNIYNDGWKPDYKSSSVKYAIYFADENFSVGTFNHASNFLTFKTAEIRDEFLANFRDLIMQAKPLL